MYFSVVSSLDALSPIPAGTVLVPTALFDCPRHPQRMALCVTRCFYSSRFGSYPFSCQHPLVRSLALHNQPILSQGPTFVSWIQLLQVLFRASPGPYWQMCALTLSALLISFLLPQAGEYVRTACTWSHLSRSYTQTSHHSYAIHQRWYSNSYQR